MLPFEKTLVDAGLAVDQLIWVKTDAVASNSHSSVASSWEHLLVAYNVKSRHDRPNWQQHFHNFPTGTTSFEKGCFMFKKRVPAALKVRYNRWWLCSADCRQWTTQGDLSLFLFLFSRLR